MSEVCSYLWLVPALPLAACVVTAFLGPRVLRRQSHWPCILALIASWVLSLFVLVSVWQTRHAHPAEASRDLEAGSTASPERPAPPVCAYYPWIQAGEANGVHVDVGVTLRADELTAIM